MTAVIRSDIARAGCRGSSPELTEGVAWALDSAVPLGSSELSQEPKVPLSGERGLNETFLV